MTPLYGNGMSFVYAGVSINGMEWKVFFLFACADTSTPKWPPKQAAHKIPLQQIRANVIFFISQPTTPTIIIRMQLLLEKV